MKNFLIHGIKVIFKDYEDATEEMAMEVVTKAEDHKENDAFVISAIYVTKVNDNFELEVEYNDDDQPKIGRIRRITG